MFYSRLLSVNLNSVKTFSHELHTFPITKELEITLPVHTSELSGQNALKREFSPDFMNLVIAYPTVERNTDL